MILQKIDGSHDKIKDLHTLKDVSSGYINNNLFVTNKQNKTLSMRKQFMLCNSCFWCASSDVHTDNIFTKKCPVCQNRRIEFLPISNNEMYNLIMI